MPHIETTQDSLKRITRMGESERYRRLEKLEAVWYGKRYELEGRPSFWDRSQPLRERAPCVVDPIARKAGRRLVSLVFGERSFPSLTLDAPLTDDRAKAFGTFMTSLVKRSKLRIAMREVLETGLMCGTVVVSCVLHRGVPKIDLIPAKWCTPTFDAHGDLSELDVRYRYPMGEDHYWYRRLITQTADTTFLPVKCEEDGKEPTWIEDPEKTFAIEVFPVLWHRHMPAPGSRDIDGDALIEGLEDEVEALDFSLSQRHRNAQYNGEPQPVITGAPSDKPIGANVGRTSESFSAGPDGRSSHYNVMGGQPALKKSPQEPWRLPMGADAKMLESSGAGAQILGGDIDDLRRLILETVEVVIADPATIGTGDLSSKALTLLLGPMLAHADNIRELYGDLLTQLLALLVRLILSALDRGESVYVTGVEAVRDLLAMASTPSAYDVTWGEYFPMSWSERQQAVQTAAQATGNARVMSTRAAVEMIAPAMGVKNVDAEMVAIDEENASGTEDTRGMLGALNVPANAPATDVPDIYGYDLEAGYITVNEARARKGFGPVDGGNVPTSVWKANADAQVAKINAAAALAATAVNPNVTIDEVKP